MKNIEKYQKLIAKGEVDALLLTSKHNRQYAAEYCIAEGVAVICKTQSYYFTDFRYIESAQKNLPGFAVKMVDTEHPYTKLINEAISDNTVKTIGFEDDTLTVEEYTLYNTKLNAVLHPYAAEINAPRASKEPWEIEYMKKAQEITDRTFDDLLNVIHPGMTEKELCAELIYRLYKYGSEGPSFDPITVSGPNTSLPHGVPSERVLQYGDFVTMDFGCLYHGYCSDMTRTIALGTCPRRWTRSIIPCSRRSWRASPRRRRAWPAGKWTQPRGMSSTPQALRGCSATATVTASAFSSMRGRMPTRATTSPCPQARSYRQSRASTSRTNSACASRM